MGVPKLDEKTALATEGVVLTSSESERRRIGEAAVRAVLNARESVTLFHSPDASEGGEGASPILIRMLAECGEEIRVPSASLIESETVEIRSLPERRREWNLSCPDRLTPRETDSFSALNRFIYSPWPGVLDLSLIHI